MRFRGKCRMQGFGVFTYCFEALKYYSAGLLKRIRGL